MAFKLLEGCQDRFVQFLPEAPGGSGATRFLVARGRDPALEFVESVLPRTARTPILFIHGAFGGAWIWTELFMPHAAKRGRPSAALSVRGHGRSEGRDLLRAATLTEYGPGCASRLSGIH